MRLLWLLAVSASFALITTLWFLLSVQRMGLRVVLAPLAIALLYRYFPRSPV